MGLVARLGRLLTANPPSGEGSREKRRREWSHFEINVLMEPWILQI
jgi:hypothetical protein